MFDESRETYEPLKRETCEPLKTETRASAGLYERLLGDAWIRLDEPVRRLHTSGSGPCGEGLFAVRRGRNFIARALARLAGLPARGEGVRVRLSVTLTEGGERWHRTFEGRSFDTSQREGDKGLLAECAGPVELLFSLSEESGALVYKQTGAALRVGRLRVPLPRSCAPRVEARERGADDCRSVNVYVSASAPLLGPMLSYEGRLSVEADGLFKEVDET
jgi:hypothetical protein